MQDQNSLKQGLQQEPKQDQPQQEVKKKQSPFLIIVAAFLLLVFTGAIGYVAYILGKEAGKEEETKTVDEITTEDKETEDTTDTTESTSTENTEDSTDNEDSYEDWKTVELNLMGFKLKIPNSWNYEESTSFDGDIDTLTLIDDNGNKYYISYLCQLGECDICEYQKDRRILFEVNIFEMQNTIYLVDCIDDMGIEELGKTLIATIDDKFEDSPSLYFGHFIDDTESSDEELIEKYQVLKMIFESFEHYSE